MPTNEERLATIEEHKNNTSKAIDAIFGYMQEGRGWREETSKCLAVLVKNQDGMTAYQTKCDDERDALDKRITEVEGFQRRAMRFALIVSSGIGYMISHGDKIYKGIKDMFT